MSRKSARSDIITGVFALGVVLSVFFVVLFLQTWRPGAEGANYLIQFSDSGGITTSSPVVVAGQRVGRVTSVLATPIGGTRDIEVRVSFMIDPEYSETIRIPIDSTANIRMAGLIGGKEMVLILGSASTYLRPGDNRALVGNPPTNLGDTLVSLQETLHLVQSGVQKLGALISDDKFVKSLGNSAALLESSLRRLDEGLEEIGPALEKVAPTIDGANDLILELRALLKENNENLSSTIKHLENAAKGADSILSKEGAVPKLVDELNLVSGNLNKLVTNLNALVVDNQIDVAVAINNIREASASIRVFARRIEADPSLLVWGGGEEDVPGTKIGPPVSDIDEWALRRSGRLPRRESD